MSRTRPPLPKPLPRGPREWLRFAGHQLLIVLLYFGTAGIGLELFEVQNASLLWLPSGFALALVLLYGFRTLPALLVGAYAVHYFQENGVAASLLIAAAYTASTAVSALLLTRVFRFQNAMERIVDVLAFLTAAVVLGSLISSTPSTLVTTHFFPDPAVAFWRTWWYKALGDSLGLVVVAPFLLVWFSRTRINWSNRQAVEVLLWIVTQVAIGFVVFTNWAPTDNLHYPLELALFPILAWGAIRFGQRGATTGVLIVSIMAIIVVIQHYHTIEAHGESGFSQKPPYLWVFVGVIAITAFFLAAIFTEHRNREARVRQNEQRLRAFLNAMPDTAFVVSEGGRVLEVFASRDSIYHGREEQIRGQALDELYGEVDAARFHTHVRKAAGTGQLQVFDYTQEIAGRTYWFEGRIARIASRAEDEEEDGEEEVEALAVWMAYDISERKRAEEALQSRDRLLRGVAEAKTNLLTTREQDAAITRALAEVGAASGADLVYVFVNRVDEITDRINLSLRYEWTSGGTPSRLEEPGLQRLDYAARLPGWLETLEQHGVLSGALSGFPQPVRDTFGPFAIQSVLAVPVISRGSLWGTIVFADCHRERKWEQSEAAILSSTAASVGGFFETKDHEEQLRRAKEVADAANLAKGEFLAMMSHEIRTPMNAILGFADLLAQSEMDEQQQEYLKIINRSGRALLELINNILDYSKIESRAIELEVVPFRLEEAILEALELVLVAANEKGIKVDYKIDDPTEGEFLGDPHRLRQILLNLVNNAVKFTEEGSVTIGARVRPHFGNQWRIDFKVTDTGIGIPAEKVTRLFKPFSQVDSSTTRQFGGTGLGLVISQRLVEKMGGDIVVESEEGRGSEFSFHILASGSTTARKETSATSDGIIDPEFAQRYPMKILLAEDDGVNQRLATEILDKLGYATDLAVDGAEALDKVKAGDYDIILMDIQMPETDGLTATRTIRAGGCGADRSDIRIVAMTAYALQEDREKCLEAGMDDYLPKPVLISDLKEALRRAYRARQER